MSHERHRGMFVERRIAAKARRAVEKIAGETAWRSMATAPHDGTEVELMIHHRNHMYAADWDRKNWEQVVRAKWIDFNGGGWTWHGLYGDPQGWRPMPANVQGEPTARLFAQVGSTAGLGLTARKGK